ncbi:MAG TPA: hypothetical protein VII99_14945, partial [Bacteroidia bacterium]
TTLNASGKIFLVKLKWFLFERLSSLVDFFLYALNVPVAGNENLKRSNKKIIVYLGEQLPPRIPRMAKWVKRSSNFSTALVCSKRGFFEKFSDPGFDAVFLFRNAFHLKRIVRQIPNIHLIHAFAPKSYFPDIVRRSFNHKFICDYQDVYSIYYGLNPSANWLQHELPHERACLEKADGIVAHSIEPNVAFRMYGIKHKPKTIFFPLYCDDDFFQSNPKKLVAENIHLVYAGGVAGSHRDPKHYGNIQFHSIIKTLSEQRIHFHIYPSPSNIRADYEEYEEVAKQNSYFHFHEPVAQHELAKELSKYHFGTMFFFKGVSEQSDEKWKYATTLKLFNYLEAGIPILVSKDLGFQSWMVERCRAGIVMADKTEIHTLREQLLKINYEQLAGNVPDCRRKISLSGNLPRLLKFYD